MKLKTASFTYVTAETKESFEINVGVSQEGRFYVYVEEIPKEIRTIGKDALSGAEAYSKGRNRYEYSNLSDLGRAIQEAIDLFESAQIQKEELKVIIYKFNLEGVKGTEKDDDGEEIPTYFNNSRYGRGNDGMVINFQYYVARQLTNKSKVRGHRYQDEVLYLDLEGNAYHVSEDEKIIEWSAEREAWFKQQEESMRTLMLGLEKFMQLDTQLVQKMIDSRLPVLPGPRVTAADLGIPDDKWDMYAISRHDPK